MTINKTRPDWEGEYHKLVDQMTKFYNENKIQEFLITHLRISQLFTHKLQWLVDNTDHVTYEYKIDASPELMRKIDEFNANLSSIIARGKLPIPYKNDDKIQGEVKDNTQGSGGEPKA